MLIIQSGNPIMKTDNRGNLKIALDEQDISGKSPTASSVKFFNDFPIRIKPSIPGIKLYPELTRCLPKARWLCISATPANGRK